VFVELLEPTSYYLKRKSPGRWRAKTGFAVVLLILCNNSIPWTWHCTGRVKLLLTFLSLSLDFKINKYIKIKIINKVQLLQKDIISRNLTTFFISSIMNTYLQIKNTELGYKDSFMNMKSDLMSYRSSDHVSPVWRMLSWLLWWTTIFLFRK
jgi:hypothetical protein